MRRVAWLGGEREGDILILHPGMKVRWTRGQVWAETQTLGDTSVTRLAWLKCQGFAALCLEVKKYKSPEFDVWSQVNFTLDFRTRGGFKVNQHQKLEASAVQS